MTSPDHKPHAPALPAPQRGCLRKLLRLGLLFLLFLGGTLWWLEADGAARLARHFLLKESAKFGLTGDAAISGGLLHGLTLDSLRLEGGGQIKEISAEALVIRWTLADLVSGRLYSIGSRGIRVVIDTRGEPMRRNGSRPIASTSEAINFSPAGLGARWQSARKVWEKFARPVALDLQGLETTILAGERTLFSLSSSALTHPSGAEEISFSLGSMSGPDGLALAPQTVRLALADDAFSLDALALPDGWVVGPATAVPGKRSIKSQIRRGPAHFQVEADGPTAPLRIRLDEGTLDLPEAARAWVKLPDHYHGTLTALDLSLGNWHLRPGSWDAKSTIGLAGLAWEKWAADSLAGTATWDGKTLKTTADVVAEKSSIKLAVTIATDDGKFSAASLAATAESPDLANPISKARARYVPAAATKPAITGSWNLGFGIHWQNGRWSDMTAWAKGSGLHVGTQSIADTEATYSWAEKDEPMHFTVAQSGRAKAAWSANGFWHLLAKSYAGEVRTDGDFDPEGLAALLDALAVKLPEKIPVFAIDWKGEGSIKSGHHSGKADLICPALGLGPRPNAALAAAVAYSWPDEVKVEKLIVQDGADALKGNIDWDGTTVSVNRLSIDLDSQPVGTVSLSLPWTASVHKIDAFLAQTQPISLTLALPERAAMDWEALLPANLRQGLTGKAGATINVGGTLEAPTLDARLDASGLGHPAGKDLAPAKLELRLTGQTHEGLQLEARVEQKDLEPITLAAKIPFEPAEWLREPAKFARLPLEGQARMSGLDLARYAALVPAARTLKGRVDIAVDVKGTTGSPAILGRASLSGGEFVPANRSTGRIADARLTIEFSGTSAKIAEGSALLGEGPLRFAGQADFSQPSKPEVDISVIGDHVMVWRDQSLLVRASPDLKFTGGPGTWKVSGKVSVRESVFFRDFEFIPIGRPFTVPTAPELPKFNPPKPSEAVAPALAGIALDVEVTTGDPILIRGNVARGEITASIRATGNAAAPSLEGAAVLTDAVARLPFSTLRIPRGEAIFQPGRGLVPDLRMQGRSKIPPYEISIGISGPADDPKVTLTSEPPLPDNEILAVLATGSTTNSLENRENAQAKAVQLLVQELRSRRLPFGRRIADLLGPLENIQLQIGQESPYDGRARNGVVLELNDRFLLTAALDSEGRQRLTLTVLFRFR